jgi:hypothetical protein
LDLEPEKAGQGGFLSLPPTCSNLYEMARLVHCSWSDPLGKVNPLTSQHVSKTTQGLSLLCIMISCGNHMVRFIQTTLNADGILVRC